MHKDGTPTASLSQTEFADLGKVGNLSLRREEHLTAILNYQSKPEQVEEWYFSEDPLNEPGEVWAQVLQHLGSPELIHRNTEENLLNIAALEKGGATLAASVVLPELFSENTGSWYEGINNLFDEYYANAHGQVRNGHQQLSADGITGFCLELIRGTKLDAPELSRLMIASEMFAKAANARQFWLRLTDGKHPWYSKADFQLARNLDNHLAGLLRTEIEDQVFVEGTIPAADERLAVGLRAKWQHAARQLSHSRIHNNDSLGEPEFVVIMSDLLSTLNTSFVASGLLFDKNEKRGWKGELHELVWMLDAYMFMATRPGYDGVYLNPAASRHDAPRLDYPSMRRGYDYYIAGPEVGEAVQLKASELRLRMPRAGQAADAAESPDYHPEIRVVAEKNFMDFDGRRLSAKLRKYDEILKGTSPEKAQATVDAYVLESVAATMTAVVSDEAKQVRRGRLDMRKELGQSLGDEIALGIIKAGFLRQPNREERRRAARAGRRKGNRTAKR